MINNGLFVQHLHSERSTFNFSIKSVSPRKRITHGTSSPPWGSLDLTCFPVTVQVILPPFLTKYHTTLLISIGTWPTVMFFSVTATACLSCGLPYSLADLSLSPTTGVQLYRYTWNPLIAEVKLKAMIQSSSVNDDTGSVHIMAFLYGTHQFKRIHSEQIKLALNNIDYRGTIYASQ